MATAQLFFDVSFFSHPLFPFLLGTNSIKLTQSHTTNIVSNPFFLIFFMASSSKEVVTDFSPFLKVYKDGTVERLWASPYVPPSHKDPITKVSSKDITISSNVSARFYLPKIIDHNRKLPVLVYFHGGGFCLGSAFSLLSQRYLNILTSEANAIVISIEYRLAPEHPLPAAYEDCWAALQWVASHVVDDSNNIDGKEPWLLKHGDFDKVYLGGDSAGGNIVHIMAIRAGLESLGGGMKILGGLLSHPYFMDSKAKKESEEEESPLYKMWMFVHPSAPSGIDNPLINPFAVDAPNLSGIVCEKLFVCCSEKDELREINLRYVLALKKSEWKGEVELVEVKGEDHCFHILDPDSEKARSLISSLGSFIKGG